MGRDVCRCSVCPSLAYYGSLGGRLERLPGTRSFGGKYNEQQVCTEASREVDVVN